MSRHALSPSQRPALAPRLVLMAISLSLSALACSESGQDGDLDADANLPSTLDASNGADDDAGLLPDTDADASRPDDDTDAATPDEGDDDIDDETPGLELVSGPTQVLAGARATLTIWLDRLAPTDTRVQLTAGEGITLEASSVEIARDTREAEVAFEAGGEAMSGVQISATLGQKTLTHTLDIVASAQTPTAISLNVAPNPVVKGDPASVTVLLDAPADEPIEVSLSADCGSLDAAVTIPAGLNAAVATFDARGCESERVDIVASADGLTGATATVGFQSEADGGLVINQVMTRGNNADAEFIELFNAGQAAIDLSPFVLWYGAARETSPSVNLNQAKGFSLSGHSIAARGHFLITFKGALNAFPGVTADIAVDVAGGFNDSAGGSIWLTTSADEAPSLAEGGYVDLVGWGDAEAYEGHAAAMSPSAENSAIKRHPDGHDTDDSAEDFTWLDLATPRGATTP